MSNFRYRGYPKNSSDSCRIGIGRQYTYAGQSDIDLVSPVPLYPKKLRNRGFNQALMLTREWGRAAAKFQVEVAFELVGNPA